MFKDAIIHFSEKAFSCFFVHRFLEPSDIGIMCTKGLVFGFVIALIACGWGQTTTGGAKGVGESTTASVVISLVAIFVCDFFLSMVFFNK